MALNPIVYTDKVVRSFLKYQLTTYPFADPRLYDQMRAQLRLEAIRSTPLLRGPYVSLSPGFRQGASVEQLVAEGVFHPHMRHVIPADLTHLYGHQERAIRAVHQGQTTLVSTGTGSGKTECFLYPAISNCLGDNGRAPLGRHHVQREAPGGPPAPPSATPSERRSQTPSCLTAVRPPTMKPRAITPRATTLTQTSQR